LIAQIEAIAEIIIPASVNTGETSSVTVDKSRAALEVNAEPTRAKVKNKILKAECLNKDGKEPAKDLKRFKIKVPPFFLTSIS